MIVDLNHFRILDDFGHELEMTDSKLQQTVLKVEKVLRLSDGRRLVFCFNSLKPLLLMTTLVQPRFFGNQFYCVIAIWWIALSIFWPTGARWENMLSSFLTAWGEMTVKWAVNQDLSLFILIWSYLHDRWGDLSWRVALSARPGNPHNRGQIFPSERFKVG